MKKNKRPILNKVLAVFASIIGGIVVIAITFIVLLYFIGELVLYNPKSILVDRILFYHCDMYKCNENVWRELNNEEIDFVGDILYDGIENRIFFKNDVSPKIIFDFPTQGSDIWINRFAVNEQYLVYCTSDTKKTSTSRYKIYRFNSDDYYKLLDYINEIGLE